MSTTKSESAAGGGKATTPSIASKPTITSPVLIEQLKKIYKTLPKTDVGVGGGSGSSSSFEEFVGGVTSALAPPDEDNDWTRPLGEYFISSSHNTYLTGHQLYGSSTTEGYINVLQRGCRCIEIDVWDGDDGEPQVFHGYTLTKEISFREVCEAVGKHAFEKGGDGPVVISLECHAGPVQQAKVVDIMKSEWGEMLVQGIPPEDVKALPSPLDLKRKILVKAKYLAPPREEVQSAALSVTTLRDPAPRLSSSSSSSSSSTEQFPQPGGKQKPAKKTKVTRALAALGIYFSSHHFPAQASNPFTEHPTSKIPNHIYSFSEKVFANLHAQHSEAIFSHNKSHLMRVYPFGLRFASSNADPTIFWRRGVQLVALNWQKCDEGMMLNEGMFAGEGGYVLKPDSFRPSTNVTAAADRTNLSLSIRVIAASAIPLPEKSDSAKRFEPYVKVELHADSPGGSLKRKTKAKKGVDCVWDEKLEFPPASVIAKLAFVRFKVHDEEFGRDDLAAWACIRVDRLRTGLRVVHLIDNEGSPSAGVLLVRIEK